ncbi:transmembrane protein 154 isoform X3 [Trachinotus anak]|uniref:transmembrane protein 154 isoform X3 n=1 Tax=Trachinotus anak TaxID=443729 RepID=UPI0039F19001
MSASRPGNMRVPRVKTSLLLLLLLLLTTLTGTVLCQSDYVDENEATEEPEADGSDPVDAELAPTISYTTLPTDPSSTDDQVLETSTEEPSITGPTVAPLDDEQNLGLIIILVLVVLVVVIIGMIVCGIFISRRWNNKSTNQELRQEDPYLDESNTEKVPMPMFEEDVPSVLELEMEELDQWMKKDGETAEV